MKMSQFQVVTNDIYLEFLEVAFNEIMYNRKLYPRVIFERKRMYGIAVHCSRHPEVNEYIKNVLGTVREMIQYDEKCMKNVNFVIYNAEKQLVEKYVFHLYEFQFDIKQSDPYFLKTEEGLRTICLKMSTANAHLKPLPEDCTFTIEIETHEAAHMAINENPKCEDFPWILKETPTEDTNVNVTNEILPLTTIKTEYLGLQMYVVTPIDNKHG